MIEKQAEFLKKELEKLGFDFSRVDKKDACGIIENGYYKDLVDIGIKSLSEVASLGDWELLGIVMLLKKWYKKKLVEAGEKKETDLEFDLDSGSFY